MAAIRVISMASLCGVGPFGRVALPLGGRLVAGAPDAAGDELFLRHQSTRAEMLAAAAGRGAGGSGALRHTSAHRCTLAGTANGAARLAIRHSPGMSVWISGPSAEMSCLDEPRRMLRS